MNSPFGKEDIPALAATYRLQWEEVQDCYVVLYPEGMVKLSASAGEIMKRCDGSSSIKDIIDDIQQKFQTQGIDQDIFNFVETAYDKGWISKK